MKVIDVSEHNGKIDWSAVKASGVEGVIIRAGYGKYSSQIDKTFTTNYNGAKNAGLKVGCYWYCYANSDVEARSEAQACNSVICGKSFDLPVYYDIEENASLRNAQSIAEAFCSMMEKFGWFVGVYASLSVWRANLGNASQKYTQWVAEWDVTKPAIRSPMWQYTARGKVSGITGPVDMDEGSDSLPEIVAKSCKNNINKPSTTKHKVTLMIDGIVRYEEDV